MTCRFFPPAGPQTVYGSRWVLVCLSVFKTGADGEQPPGWVQSPHAPAKRNAPLTAALSFWRGHVFMFLIFIFF